MTVSVPRETKEYVPVTVEVDGVAVSAAVEFAIVADGSRPVADDWADAYVDGSDTFALVDGLSAGEYNVWARATAGAEVAVMFAGRLQVT